MRQKLAIVGISLIIFSVLAGCERGQVSGSATEAPIQQADASNRVVDTPTPVITGGVSGQPLPTQRYACDDGTVLFIGYDNASRLIQFAEINIDGIQYSLPGRAPPKGVNGKAYVTTRGRHGVSMEWWLENNQSRLVDVTYTNGNGYQRPNYDWTSCQPA